MAVSYLPMPSNTGNQTVSFPISKFSHTTTSTVRISPLPWTHLSGGSDLVAIFEHTHVPGTASEWVKNKRILKILRGGEKLEELDLDLLAQSTSSSASGGRSQMQSQKPHAAIVVKLPMLAVRYPTGTNQIRRFQVKFVSGDDFNKVLSIFTEAGCSVIESNVESNSQAHLSRQIAPGLTPSKMVGDTIPSMASTGCAPFDSQSQSWRPLGSNITETRPSSMGSSVTLTSVDPSQTRFAEPRPSSMGSLITPPNTAASYRTNPGSSSGMEWSRAQENGDAQSRPSTAQAFPDVETLNQLLPPKRELPFARSTKKNVGQPPPAQRPKKAAPKQRPQVQSQATTACSKNAKSSLASEAQPHPANRPAQTEATGTQSECHTTQVTQDGRTLNPSSGMSPPKRPLEDISNTYQTSHTKVLCREDRSVQMDVAAEPTFQHPLAQVISAPPTSCQTNEKTVLIPPSQDTQQPQSPQKQEGETISSVDFSAYLANPSADRSALVESWVCQQLESNDFLSLCQDVERVWKRIAFGM